MGSQLYNIVIEACPPGFGGRQTLRKKESATVSVNIYGGNSDRSTRSLYIFHSPNSFTLASRPPATYSHWPIAASKASRVLKCLSSLSICSAVSFRNSPIPFIYSHTSCSCSFTMPYADVNASSDDCVCCMCPASTALEPSRTSPIGARRAPSN